MPGTRHLLYILPMVVGLGLAGVVAILLSLERAYRDQSDHLLQVDLPVLQQVEQQLNRLDHSVTRLHQLMRENLKMDEAEFKQHAHEVLDHQRFTQRQVDREVAAFLDNFDESYIPSVIAAHKALQQQLGESHTLMVRMLDAGSSDSATINDLLNEVAAAQLAVNARANDLRQQMRTITSQEFRQFSTEFSAGLARAIVYSSSILLLAIALSLYIVHRLGRSLRRVSSALELLARNPEAFDESELPAEQEYQSIALVAKRLAATQQQLLHTNLELEQERNTLEARIKENTAHLTETNAALRKEVQERSRIQQSLELYKTMVDASAEPILITDSDNHILEANAAYLHDTGYSRSEVIGQKPTITRSGHHDDTFFLEMWEAIRNKGSWSGEIWDQRKDGEVRPKQMTINRVADETGKTRHYIAVLRDISEQKAQEKKLTLLAFNDPLTGLPNRALFKDRLQLELVRSKRNKSRFALFFIDLDGFKPVNDHHGHEVGDVLLAEVAERLRHCLRQSDTLARHGGDEFTVILPDAGNNQAQKNLAWKIITSLQKPFLIAGHSINIGASIGIAYYPDHGADYEELLRHADQAMYQAKEAGRGTCATYSEAHNET